MALTCNLSQITELKNPQQSNSWFSLTIAIWVGIIGLLGVPPIIAAAETSPPQSPASPENNTTENPDLAEAEQLNQQVIKLYNQGQYAAAIPLAQKVLAIREKVFGANHPDIAVNISDLGMLYRNNGQYDQAEPLYQRALAIREQFLGANHPDVATSLNNLALLYHDQGKYDQAEPLYQRALAIREQVLGADHPNIATSLNNLAELYKDRGKYDQVESLYQRALAIFEKALGANHPNVATSLNNLAGLYRYQGKYDQAEPLYQRALAIREQVLGAEHPDVAISLNSMALLYQEQGKYAQAESLFQRALAIVEKVLGANHPDVATSLNNLAELYRDQGKYTQAEPLYQRALAIWEQVLGADNPQIALGLNNLALLYKYQGKYAQAERLYQRSLSILEKFLGANHPQIAISLNNLALLYQTQGKYTKAEPLLQRAIAIRVQVLGDNHLEVGEALNNLAVLYRYQGKYDQAEPLSQRALAIFEKTLGANHPKVGTTLNNLAALYADREKYTQAEPLYQRALMIREQALGKNHPDVASSLNNLAALYQDQDKYAEAQPLFEQALAITENVLGSEHPEVATSLNNLAALYQDREKYVEAEPLFQKAVAISEKVLGADHPEVAINVKNLAFFYQVQGDIPRTVELLTRSIEIEEKNLAVNLTAGSEADKLAYIDTIANTTNRTISLHLQTAPDNLELARLAFTTILQRKGRVLDALADSLEALRRNLTPENQILFDQLAKNRAQLSALIFDKPANLSLEEYRQQIDDLKAETIKLEIELSRRSAQFLTVSQPTTIEAIQKFIPTDAALVELVFYYPYYPKASQSKRWGKPHYAAYILHSQGEPAWVDLGETAPIDKAWQQLRPILTDVKKGNPAIKSKARALDALLMQPIRQKLGDSRHILLSPDGQLNLIPFATLVDEKDQYLVENYTITYLTAARDLLRLSQHSANQNPPVLIANPDFDNAGNLGNIQIASGTRSSENERSTELAKLQFGALPGTAEEAKTIAPLVSTFNLLTGPKATENALKQLKSPSILHIATHGFFLQDLPAVAPKKVRGGIEIELISNAPALPIISNQENPLLRSGIALAGFNPRQSGGEDGVLTALEAAGLNLYGTKLVVLSACETGLGDATNGDGVYGLRRALVISGAESQLMSMWKVSDFGTKELMVQYYQRILKGEGRSEALRQTQLGMLQSQQYKHPYYWGAFIPSGDWTPAQF